MTVAPGTRIGPYEITAKLGEGGMGEVYRATDSKLRREVAIKVLPGAFAVDKERLARFEREAQVLAQLHHPNIASIFGLEESGGVRALVMELVDGEDLSAVIARGPLPIADALGVARQIADALEAAHERGIVHRDLKPANVKVQSDGTVKVLDFGLAKAMDTGADAAPQADLARSPTLMNSPTLTAVRGTQLGVILGTAAYMAPEQARGGAVDKRADIWAFGVVLHEMLAGRSLFAAETVSDTLAGVLKNEIDLRDLPAATPAAVRRLLRWCLERNPKNRLHDIADARLLLAEAIDGKEETASAAPPPRSLVARWAPWLLAAAGLAFGTIALFLAKRDAGHGAAAPTTRVRIMPATSGAIDGFPSLSPDGRTLVFGLIGDDGVSHLQSYSFDSGETRLLPGTARGEDPFWSPDGHWLGFFAEGHVSKLELASGLTQPLAAAPDPRGGCWSDTGDIYFTPNSSAGLFRVPAAGGPPERVTESDPAHGEQSHRYPTCLPGNRLVYTVMGDAQAGGIVWRSLRDGTVRRLAGEISRTAFDARGYLLWARQSSLVAQRFDAVRGDLRGDPVAVAERVGLDGQRAGLGWFDAAGGVVALRRSIERSNQLRWFDRAGQPLQEVTSPGFFLEPALSPDGTHVAVNVSTKYGAFGDIWSFAVDGKDRGSRITFDSQTGAQTPGWTDGGRSVVFSFSEKGAYGIGRRAADGTGETETLWTGPSQAFVDDTTARGPLAVLEVYDRDGGVDLWLMPLTGDHQPHRFGEGGRGSRAHGAFSPDGRLLAYTSDESGLSQVYVADVAASANRWQVTTDGGDLPQWRADGKELYWVGLDRVLRASPVQSLAPFSAGTAVRLFPLAIPKPSLTGNHSFYYPGRDGQRFLVRAWIGEESEPGFLVTLNWQGVPNGGR